MTAGYNYLGFHVFEIDWDDGVTPSKRFIGSMMTVENGALRARYMTDKTPKVTSASGWSVYNSSGFGHVVSEALDLDLFGAFLAVALGVMKRADVKLNTVEVPGRGQVAYLVLTPLDQRREVTRLCEEQMERFPQA